MSATNIFRCKDTMVSENEAVASPTSLSTPQRSEYANLPGSRKFSNDVQSARGGMPNPTGRRP